MSWYKDVCVNVVLPCTSTQCRLSRIEMYSGGGGRGGAGRGRGGGGGGLGCRIQGLGFRV